MRKILQLTFGLLIILITTVKAQVANYPFSQFSSSYVAISGGTVFGNTSSDDQFFVDPSVPLGGFVSTGVGIPIGFNFNFNGNSFDMIAICNNGFISLGQSTLTPNQVDINTSSSYNPISSTSTGPTILQNRIGGLGIDLQGQTNSELRVQTIGSIPNRTLVVQFAGYREYAASGDSFDFQIRLSETTNKVDLVYGNFTTSNSGSAEVGLRGSGSDFNNRDVTNPNAWSTSIAGSFNYSTVNFDASTLPTSGQTYEWSPPPGCTGTPASGTAAIASATGCINSPFGLTATGLSSASGLIFQWQSAPASSGPWTNIIGATTVNYTTSTAAITFYQMVTTCTVSSLSATTSVVSFTPGNCFTMSNTTITTCSGSLFDSGGPSSNYQNNENYTLTIIPSTPNSVASLTFVSFSTETNFDYLYIYDGNSTSSPLIGQFTGFTLPPVITATNLAGILTLKFTSDFSNTDPGFEAAISCYITPTCSGMPSSGTASISSTGGCGNTPFNLSASGISNGIGIQYQWQSGPTASGPWTSVSNATNTAYSTSVTSTTFYQMVTTCTVSSLSATTTVVSYSVTGPCYFMSNSTVTACSGTIYDSGGPTANYQNNESYTMTLLPSTANNMVSLNFNSFATEAGYDTLYIYDGNSTSSPLIGGFSGSTLPPVITATNNAGILTLRFKSDPSVNYAGWDATLSCFVPPTCSGTPSSGIASISSPSGCPTSQFIVSATGISTGLGISYQWQSAPASSGPWSSIPTATNNAYTTSTSTTTYYQMVTTCSVSSLSATTSVVSYSVVNPGPCVCNNYGASSAQFIYDEEIWNVSFGTLNNTSNCTTPAPGPGSALNLYANYAGFVSAPTVLQGQSVPFNVNVNTCGGWYGMQFSIYIDYNQNGLFTDPGELVYTNANAIQGNNTGNILIPNTTGIGTTRMRVVAVEGAAPSPTGTYFYGETEDYCIDIQVPVPCAGTPSAGIASISTPTGCISDVFNLNASNITNALGITYQWQSAPSASGPWANIATATNVAYSTSTSTTTFFQMVTTCTNSSQSATTSVVSYTPFNCYTMSNTTITTCGGTLYDSGGSNNNYQNNEDYTLTIVPSTANASVTLTFNVFSTENTYDYLYVYDGNSTAAPLIGQYTGNTLPPNITASNAQGILTLEFTSDFSNTDIGFDIALSCSTTCLGPPAAPSASGAVICSGNSTTLTTIVTGTAQWYATSTPTAPIATGTLFTTPILNSNTTYYVRDTAACGASSLTAVNVTVNTTPTLTAVSSNSAICIGSSATLTASNVDTYTWSTNATTSVIIVSPTVTTNYLVTGYSSLCNITETANVNVGVNPLPTVSLTSSGVSTICATPGNIALVGTPSGGVYSGVGVTGNLLNITNPGTFTPMYSYTSSVTGCSNFAVTSVTVVLCGGGTGLSTQSSTIGLSVMPNPNTGIFNIETNSFVVKTIELTDITGRVVHSEVSDLSTIQVNINELANGIYYLRVNSTNGTNIIKVIKQ